MHINLDILAGRISATADGPSFLTARPRVIAAGHAHIVIIPDDPAAGFDDQRRGAHLRVPELRRAHGTPGAPMLLSGGTILTVRDSYGSRYLPMGLRGQRGATTIDGGLLTTAAGRCSEMPAETCYKELAEEFMLVVASRRTGKRYLLSPSVRDEHFRLAHAEYARLLQTDAAIDRSRVAPILRREPEPRRDLESTAITVEVAGQTSRSEHFRGAVFYDAANNTLELRRFLELPLYPDERLVGGLYLESPQFPNLLIFDPAGLRRTLVDGLRMTPADTVLAPAALLPS